MTAEPISPELCLVCPELRARALAPLAADLAPAAPEHFAPMPVRIGAYLAVRLTQAATECAVFGAVVAALALAASLP